MIEVFKTNVQEEAMAKQIMAELHQRIPMAKINFDLDDCDRILRVDMDSTEAFLEIQRYLQQAGFRCEVLKN